MKIEQQANKVQSTMHGESVTMGIRHEDMAHIMDVLAGLYSNRLLAVIREYSTNAWDAHVEANVSLPVEVTLPTALSPFLKVRDYGHGLDADGIREVYSQYGRSTKRNTNDQVGMLGLGSKCALSYTQQFTITSVSNGRRIAVMVSRDEDGAGHMEILGDPTGVATDDANGTEVMVSIRREDHIRAENEAAEFFAYWPAGSVTVNGKQPKRFNEGNSAFKLSDALWIIPGGGNDKIVMGNVAYPQAIDLGIAREGSYDYRTRRRTEAWSLVAFVPIGAVKPVPSRESLKDTVLTQGALAQVKIDYEQHVKGAIQREVDNAVSPQDAIRTIVKWADYVPGAAASPADYTYKRTRLPDAIQANQPAETMETTTYKDGYKMSHTYLAPRVEVKEWPGIVWVVGFAPANFVAQHKHKLRKWCETQGFEQGSVTTFVLMRGMAKSRLNNPFIDQARIVDWETVRSIKLDPKPRGYMGSVRIPGSFDVFTEGGHKNGVPGDSLRQDKPLFWARGNRWLNADAYEALLKLYPEFTLVLLPANRVDKFVREVTAAKPVKQGIIDAYDKWAKQQNADDLKALAMQDDHVKGFYAALDPSKVNDPALKRAAKIAKRDVGALFEARKVFGRVVNVTTLAVKYDKPLTKYPLYSPNRLKENPLAAKHTYLYLNMIHDKGV